MVGGQLQQRRPLHRRVAATRERLLEARAHLARGQVGVRRRHHERGARQDTQRLGHALARLQHGDAAGRHVDPPGNARAVHARLGIELGRRLAGPHRLHVGDEIEEILERRVVSLEPHGIRAREGQPQRELGLGQPAVELMPEEPGGHRLRRRLGEEHAVPRDQHVLQPELAVQLVEAPAHR